MRWRPPALTLAAIVCGGFGWRLGHWAAGLAGLGDLGFPIAAAGVFAALTLAEAAFTRFVPTHPQNRP